MTSPQNLTAPLWQQLQAVAQALAQVRRGVSGTAALETVPSALRPGVQALFFQVLRQLGRAQALGFHPSMVAEPVRVPCHAPIAWPVTRVIDEWVPA